MECEIKVAQTHEALATAHQRFRVLLTRAVRDIVP